MSTDHCLSCRYFLRFTATEAATYRAKLAQLKVSQNITGGCTYKPKDNPLVIRRYISVPVEMCPYWQSGYFEDPVGMRCPQCKQGQIVVKRPGKDKRTFTLIGCSRYPNCTFSTRSLRLPTPCRVCNISLVLTAGEQLKVTCPQCSRSAVVPLTVASWPILFKVGDTCPHLLPWRSCNTCAKSESEKLNLIDVELPKAAAFLIKIGSPQPSHRRSSYTYADSDDYDNYDPEMEEEMRLINDEIASDRVDYSRSHSEGWYYDEGGDDDYNY